MPRTPILARETFFALVRGGPKDYQNRNPLKQLEWNVVETELGFMVEPRQCQLVQYSPVVQMDMTDAAYTKISQIDESSFQNQYGTGGAMLIDYNS